MEQRTEVRRGHARSKSRTPAKRTMDIKTQIRTIKLIACVVIFLAAVIIRTFFPAFFATVGEHVTTSVDYRTALAILGEGVSGEREFIAAVGEAFTYAFRGGVPDAPDTQNEPVIDVSDSADSADVVDAFVVHDSLPDSAQSEEAAQSDAPDIIFSAFVGDEGFEYFNIPVGATLDAPTLGLAHATPIDGVVTSGFGAADNGGFNHGVDIAPHDSSAVLAFADGEVIAVGQSATQGTFIIISHDGAETRYAHLGETLVSTGQTVAVGDIIAHAESDMRFELRIDGLAVNPEHYISWD